MISKICSTAEREMRLFCAVYSQTPHLPQVFPTVRDLPIMASFPSMKSSQPEEPRVQLIAYSRRETQLARF